MQHFRVYTDISHLSSIFDGWTSTENKRHLNLIARHNNIETNFVLIKVQDSAFAQDLSSLIKQKLLEIDRHLKPVNFFICDGAAVNKKNWQVD